MPHPAAVPVGVPVDIVHVARSIDIDRVDHSPTALSALLPRPVEKLSAGPIPGTVPNTIYDPWAPFQLLPAPASAAPPRTPDAGGGYGSLDAALTAAQLAIVARGKLDRARAYAGRLGAHAGEIRSKLAAAADHQVAAAIGRAESDPADVGPLRGELIEIDRQHRQALEALADIEAEHVRHEADLTALTGSDGTARAKLVEAHAARSVAQTAVDAAKAILDRAKAHAEAVDGKLADARAVEARYDADATARLRAALADGNDLPAVAEAFTRTSPALEDDLRAATATVDLLKADHALKLDALAVAHRAVLAAVDGVLVVDAEAVARELQAADSRALALRTRLHCYTKRTAGDYIRPTPKPHIVHPNGMAEPHPTRCARRTRLRL